MHASHRWAGRTRARRTGVISGLVLVAVLVICPPVLAGPGSLDPTFDGDGRVTSDLGSADEGAVAVAVQPDGKIVVLGVSPGGMGEFALARYTPSGMLDPDFDGDGIRAFDGIDPADVAVQPDGKIVVAGSADFDTALARFNTDGTPDTAFGDNGIAAGSFDVDRGRAVALQPDGKIVVVGFTDQESEGGDGVIVRFNSDGALDSSFGGGDGRRLLVLGDHSSASAVSIRPNGKIVVAGYGWNDGQGLAFAVTRLLGDGSSDESFSGDGEVRTDFGPDARATDVAVQPDGKIVAAGSAGGDFALARYTERGRLDVTFSGDGRKRTDFSGGNDQADGLALQANGRIVLAGSAAPPRHPRNANFGLARYRSNGELDLTFSRNGKQRSRFGPNLKDFGSDVALQSDGRIIVVGRVTLVPDDDDFGLARYLGR